MEYGTSADLAVFGLEISTHTLAFVTAPGVAVTPNLCDTSRSPGPLKVSAGASKWPGVDQFHR
ncbi:hypothetical protein [Nonomuraea recticatena]|uniref:hypothetical protein n=1 Tax=Nonomuraea recticatena TaxID=46178 RepID=UPI00361256A6